jgi:hypothetical protein
MGYGITAKAAGVAYPLQLKSSASVSGSISKPDISKKIKSGLAKDKILEQIKNACSCDSLKLTLTAAFHADGTFKSLKVKMDEVDGGCACSKEFKKSLKASLEKSLSTLSYPGTGSLVITYPLVLSP